MNRPLALTSALVCTLALLAPAPARAEGALAQASALYDAGRFDEALRVLLRARPRAESRAERARIDLQLGIVHAVLGQEERARAAFIEALRGDPRAALDERVHKASVVELFGRTRAALRGQVQVGGRRGVLVVIDGREVGRTPLGRSLPIGPHRIEVRAGDGQVLFRQDVVLAPDGRERVWVSEALVVGVAPPPRSGAEPAAPRRIWTWVALGATALEAGACVGLYLWARSGYNEYQTTGDPLRFDELAGTVPKRYQAAQALLGVTLATAAASVVLFFVEGRPRAAERQVSARGLRFSF